MTKSTCERLHRSYKKFSKQTFRVKVYILMSVVETGNDKALQNHHVNGCTEVTNFQVKVYLSSLEPSSPPKCLKTARDS